MKTVVYSNGDGHDYVIYAVLQVPEEMTQEDINGLWGFFKKEYYPNEPKVPGGFTNAQWDAHRQYMEKQKKVLHAKGYRGDDENDLFVSWLCGVQGCRKIAYEEWY